MGTLAQNLQAGGDRLQEFALIFNQAANNNRWNDLLTILPQIQNIIVSTAIQLGEMVPNAVPSLLIASRANVEMLEDTIKHRDEKHKAEMEAQMKAGEVSDKPSEV